MPKIQIYGLSTCIHCRNAMKYLDEKGLKYDKTMVDLLDGDQYDAAIEDVRKINPNLSFPTIVINNKYVVAGFQKDKLDDLLE